VIAELDDDVTMGWVGRAGWLREHHGDAKPQRQRHAEANGQRDADDAAAPQP